MFYNNHADGLICSSFRPFFTGFSGLKQSVYRHTLTKTQCLQSFYWISDPLLLIHERCKVILKPDWTSNWNLRCHWVKLIGIVDMEMVMIWIWQGEWLKNLFIPKYVPSWFFLPFSSLALQICSEALHTLWFLHSARACTKLLVLKCGQANNTGHFKKIPHLSPHRKELNLPTVFACWKVLRTSLFQSRPSPFGQ